MSEENGPNQDVEQDADAQQTEHEQPEAAPSEDGVEAPEAPAPDATDVEDAGQAEAVAEPAEEPAEEGEGAEDASTEDAAGDDSVSDSSEASSDEEASADESSEQEQAQEQAAAPEKDNRRKRGGRRQSGNNIPDVSRELKRLVELATKFPEIGAPLAQLSTKLGYNAFADRLLNMGLEDEARGVEYFIVAANLARKEGRSSDVLDAVLSGVRDYASSEEIAPDISTRLLHLVRLGFAVLMFDLENLQSAPEFSAALAAELPALKPRFEQDPFYTSLLAQALWFEDKDASEATWEEAVAMGEAETTWNARGTWYKEAEKDLARAEGAYRSGLKLLPTSVLLLHNLGQVLTDRAAGAEVEVEQKRNWLNEAESLLRQAHRRARRHHMRRHINSNIERIKTMQQELPREVREVKPPEVGDVLTGRVNNIKEYGAFISLGNGLSGLVHKSELAHEYVQDPRDYVKSGEPIEVKVIEVKQAKKGGQDWRISLSVKALTAAPEGQQQNRDNNRGGGNRGGGGNNRNNNRGGNRGGGNRNRGGGNRGGGNNRNRGGNNNRNNNQNNDQGGLGSLGELLLAKLEERKNDD